MTNRHKDDEHMDVFFDPVRAVMLIVLLVSAPLAIWKLVDIALWMLQ